MFLVFCVEANGGQNSDVDDEKADRDEEDDERCADSKSVCDSCDGK